MTENGSAKRVIIKKDADTLADYVATRFVNRIVKFAEARMDGVVPDGGAEGTAVNDPS